MVPVINLLVSKLVAHVRQALILIQQLTLLLAQVKLIVELLGQNVPINSAITSQNNVCLSGRLALDLQNFALLKYVYLKQHQKLLLKTCNVNTNS